MQGWIQKFRREGAPVRKTGFYFQLFFPNTVVLYHKGFNKNVSILGVLKNSQLGNVIVIIVTSSGPAFIPNNLRFLLNPL